MKNKGFTLVELVAVSGCFTVIVIVIVAAIAACVFLFGSVV
jgi:competence protein ComGC